MNVGANIDMAELAAATAKRVGQTRSGDAHLAAEFERSSAETAISENHI
jgi:hypothetical protein